MIGQKQREHEYSIGKVSKKLKNKEKDSSQLYEKDFDYSPAVINKEVSPWQNTANIIRSLI